MTERKRFLLRIDPGAYAEIEKWAADDLRSVNAQIEYLLLQALERAGRRRKGRPPPTEGVGARAEADGGGDEGGGDEGTADGGSGASVEDDGTGDRRGRG